MSIDVTPVASRRDLRRFIDFPHELYRDDACYVPHLHLSEMSLLGREHNPFLLHSDMELFLATRRGRVAGRIAAIENRVYNEHHGDRQGFFGFFDCEDDADAAAALFASCENWLVERGLTGMRGPVNPDMNNSCGLLTEGFSLSPAVFMPYNKSYYRRLVEEAGLGFCKGLNAWEVASERVPESAVGYEERLRRHLTARGYVLRNLDLARFGEEMEALREVYNDSLAGSWGFSPITREEFAERGAGLRRICAPEFIPVAEREGAIVGYIGAVPDLNEVLRHIPRGRLLPFGWAKLLAGRRRIRWCRIVMYGVHRQHRHSGLGTWLYLAIIRAARACGFAGAEASYVLEDNRPVNRLSLRLGGVCRKRYGMFEKTIGRERSAPKPAAETVRSQVP